MIPGWGGEGQQGPAGAPWRRGQLGKADARWPGNRDVLSGRSGRGAARRFRPDPPTGSGGAGGRRSWRTSACTSAWADLRTGFRAVPVGTGRQRERGQRPWPTGGRAGMGHPTGPTSLITQTHGRRTRPPTWPPPAGAPACARTAGRGATPTGAILFRFLGHRALPRVRAELAAARRAADQPRPARPLRPNDVPRRPARRRAWPGRPARRLAAGALRWAGVAPDGRRRARFPCSRRRRWAPSCPHSLGRGSPLGERRRRRILSSRSPREQPGCLTPLPTRLGRSPAPCLAAVRRGRPAARDGIREMKPAAAPTIRSPPWDTTMLFHLGTRSAPGDCLAGLATTGASIALL